MRHFRKVKKQSNSDPSIQFKFQIDFLIPNFHLYTSMQYAKKKLHIGKPVVHENLSEYFVLIFMKKDRE